MKIAAVVVSRKGSKRLLNKSKQKIKNQTLVERKISQLKKINLIHEIYLGTNDLSFKNLSKKYNIKFIKREDKYCNEKLTNAKDMIKNMLKYVDADVILWAHPTNPLIDEKLYTDAIKQFKKSKKKFDSLFSVTKLKNHFWNNKRKPINHNPFAKKHVISEKLPPIFFQNGGIFIRYKKDMIKDGGFIGKKPLMFILNEIQGMDIDYEWQLKVARTLIKHKFAH